MKTFLYKTTPDLNATWSKAQITRCLLRLNKKSKLKISSSSNMLFTDNDEDDYIFMSINIFMAYRKKKVDFNLHVKVHKPLTTAVISAFKTSFSKTVQKISTLEFNTLQAIVKRQKAPRRYSYSKSYYLVVSPDATIKLS